MWHTLVEISQESSTEAHFSVCLFWNQFYDLVVPTSEVLRMQHNEKLSLDQDEEVGFYWSVIGD